MVDQHQVSEVTKDLIGQRVVVRGKFDYSQEILLGLRSAPMGLTGGPAQGLTSNPQGYFLITPLVITNGARIYINRGWVSRGNVFVQNRKLLPVAKNHNRVGTGIGAGAGRGFSGAWCRPAGTVEVECVIMQPERQAMFTPTNDPSSGIVLWLEPKALIEAANRSNDNFITGDDRHSSNSTGSVNRKELEDNFVLAEAVSVTGMGAEANGSTTSSVVVVPFMRRVEELQEQAVAPITHAVYAFTWFSLCAAGIVMTYGMFNKKKKLLKYRSRR
mmetsp:Transcript_8312/g.13959  ORF Transcript_8312/g.13959 Transcript_8312/m.13959 type:complete len:273 (+) Transcript_8312:2-820(+)